MYQIVKKGTEYEFFSEDVINHIYTKIQNEISKYLSLNENPEDGILGAFALHDVPMKNGIKRNVWIEFNAIKLGFGFFNVDVHNCIIYDEIPDIVLDKYNQIKAVVYNSLCD
jgi:hypothetical protein